MSAAIVQHRVTHPGWCDPEHCFTVPPEDWGDGTTLIHHRAVIQPGLVEVYDVVEVSTASEVISRETGVLLRDDVNGDTEITPDQAARLAGALIRAAAAIGGTR